MQHTLDASVEPTDHVDVAGQATHQPCTDLLWCPDCRASIERLADALHDGTVLYPTVAATALIAVATNHMVDHPDSVWMLLTADAARYGLDTIGRTADEAEQLAAGALMVEGLA